MGSPKPGGFNEKPRYPRYPLPAESVAEASESESRTLRSHDRIWPRQKPAKPDAVDIARTWAVIIVGGLTGIMTVVVVFMLLKP